MDDKLILAVFNYPELYNVTQPNYRCTESRASAWRNISLALGLPREYLVHHNFTELYANQLISSSTKGRNSPKYSMKICGIFYFFLKFFVLFNILMP